MTVRRSVILLHISFKAGDSITTAEGILLQKQSSYAVDVGYSIPYM